MSDLENKKNKFLDFFQNLDRFSYQIEDFFQKNTKKISIGFLSIVGLFVIYFTYEKAYLKPREEKALNFFSSSRELFLKNYDKNNLQDLEKSIGGNSKEGFMGFIDIIQKYPSTKASNLANFYAALTYFKLKKYEKSIEHLKAFSSRDDILPSIKQGLIGDNFTELNKKEEALSHYLKAAKEKNNEFTEVFYYQKAALLAFSMDRYKEAKDYIEMIQKRYPESKTSIDLDKYLAMSNYKLSKKD